MYCLVQLYLPVSAYLKPQKPILKLFSIKAVGMYTWCITKDQWLLITHVPSILDLLASHCSILLHDTWFSQRCAFIYSLLLLPLHICGSQTWSYVFQTQYMTADNINIGLGAILETFEMTYVPNYTFYEIHI